jgi:hypothetical protein
LAPGAANARHADNRGRELIVKGQAIQIVRETDFATLVNLA